VIRCGMYSPAVENGSLKYDKKAIADCIDHH
jgi:hypothetical protein